MVLKIHKLYTCGYKDKLPEGAVVINTTSRSNDFGKAFSPFMNQGPINHGGLVSENVENLWQFTKVYPEHKDNFEAWKKWRDAGLKDKFAHRYPMGKGAKPLFSWPYEEAGWDSGFDNPVDYIEARERIYIPAYKQKLEKYCQKQVQWVIGMLHVADVYLWDFDGYLTDKPFKELVEDPSRSLGHSFIIKKVIADQLKIEY